MVIKGKGNVFMMGDGGEWKEVTGVKGFNFPAGETQPDTSDLVGFKTTFKAGKLVYETFKCSLNNVTEILQKEEKEIMLQALSYDKFDEAKKYIETSKWSLQNMIDYFSAFGEIPPDDLKSMPIDIDYLIKLRYAGKRAAHAASLLVGEMNNYFKFKFLLENTHGCNPFLKFIDQL